jgi:dolichol-phosphate mannosyltransferase
MTENLPATGRGPRSLCRLLSVVMPARNEAESLPDTVSRLSSALDEAGIDHEIVIVNDNSTDDTAAVCQRLAQESPRVRCLTNDPPGGFGLAVRKGLAGFTGDAVAIMMADASDDPADLVRAWQALQNGRDCVFGTRFDMGGRVVDYPVHKLVINRLANLFIRFLFGHGYDDTTNAFKLYRREVIDGIAPLLSHHFNLTVEMPLKAIVRGYDFGVIPMTWRNRKAGVSKLRIQEMGSRYLFIVLYVWLEKHLSRGDYVRPRPGEETAS